MSMAYQPSILETGPEAAGRGGTALRPLAAAARTRLSHGAWVDHLPGWLTATDEAFATLLHEVPWRSERRRMFDIEVAVPRLLAWYGTGEDLPHRVLRHAKTALDAHYAEELGETFATAGLCLYRDGRDSVAWHGDTIGRGSHEDTMVAILSLGSPRYLHLRPRDRRPGHRDTLRFALGHGDLLVMGGSCQWTWEHCVPKTTQAVGPRISVQFRPAGVT